MLRCGRQAPRIVQRGLASVNTTLASLARERRLLRGVIDEASQQHITMRQALQRELQRAEREVVLTLPHDEEKAAKTAEKQRRRLELVPQRLAAAEEAELHLAALRELSDVDAGADGLSELRRSLEELGLGHRLEGFDVDAQPAQWGRPEGWRGLVIESPRGVPILVGRRTSSDDVLRRASSGADLWFQEIEGHGSRVVLRLALGAASSASVASPRTFYAAPPSRGCYKGPQRRYDGGVQGCMQMAADVAAYFSDADDEGAGVEIMYTDARRVAARGARIGQLKPSKRLGALRGWPEAVADVVRRAEVEQADLR